MARAHLSTKLQPENEALMCESAVIVTFVGDNTYSLVFAGDVPNASDTPAEVFARRRLAQARDFISQILQPKPQLVED